VRLQHRRPGPHDLAALAPGVARRAGGGQAAARRGPAVVRRQRPLAGGLARAVTADDEQALPLAIEQPAEVVVGEAVPGEILVEEPAEGGQARRIDVGEEAAEGRAMGPAKGARRSKKASIVGSALTA
jgi:hypothetical protein